MLYPLAIILQGTVAVIRQIYLWPPPTSPEQLTVWRHSGGKPFFSLTDASKSNVTELCVWRGVGKKSGFLKKIFEKSEITRNLKIYILTPPPQKKIN